MPGQLDVTVSYWRFDPVLLAAGQDTTWFYTWVLFDEARYVDFDATPDNVRAPGGGFFSLEVVSKRADRAVGGRVTYVVTYLNRGSIPLVFRPRVVVAPAGRYFGGLDR